MPQDKDKDKIKGMGGQIFHVGDAVARFTKDPITLDPPRKDMSVWTGSESPEGMINDRTRIFIAPPGMSAWDRARSDQLNTPISSHEDVSAHEQIHSLLDKFGLGGKLPKDWQGYSIPRDIWDESDRLGDYKLEMPAYLGSFVPGQLKGLSGEDRMKYLNQYRNEILLDPRARKTFEDIVKTQSYGHPELMK